MNPTLPRFFWSEYRKRRKKAALITFALFWGTLSILLLMAFGQGMSTQFRVAFSGLGDTLIMVYGGQTSLEVRRPAQGASDLPLPRGRRLPQGEDPGDPAYRPGVLQLPPGLGQRQGDQPHRPRHHGRIRLDADPGPSDGRPLPQRRRRCRGTESRLHRLEASPRTCSAPRTPSGSRSSSTASRSPSSASSRRRSRIRCTTARTPTRSICRFTPTARSTTGGASTRSTSSPARRPSPS